MATKRIILSLILIISLALAMAGCASPAEEGPAADIAAAAAASQTALTAQLTAMHDNYAAYYTADEYRLMFDDYQGSFGGVGISMTEDQGEIIVYSLLPDTPAARSGLLAPGDVILKVDGASLAGLDTSQAALLIRGELGTQVLLELRRASDQQLYSVTLTREEIISESVSGEIIEEAANTAYILVYNFTEHTATEFVDTYNELRQNQQIDNIILDLRSNGGGSFYAATDIANYFVPAGRDVVMEKTADGMQHYSSTSGQLRQIRLVILQNRWTASASEVLTGALRDEAGAVVVGSTSFGKGLTQTVSQLPSGSGLRYTRSRYYTPSGYDLHGLGIVPDYVVEDPEQISSDDYFSTDPLLNPHLAVAVEYLQQKQAPTPPGGPEQSAD